MDRQIWVIDCETSGLDTSVHVPLEIAAVNVATGEEIEFVPWLPEGALDAAEPAAMAINQYFERRVWERRLGAKATSEEYENLWDLLSDNILAGSNPRFDAAMLMRGRSVLPSWACGVATGREPWHRRLLDLSAFAAGRLGLPPDRLPGLDVVCDLLDVTNKDAHTALGDARAAAECFRRLTKIEVKQ